MYRKIIVIGESSGKTTFVRKLTGNNQAPMPTLGVELNSYQMTPQMRLNIWDVSASYRGSNMGHGYYMGADGCLLFFDASANRSPEALRELITLQAREVSRVCENIPIVVVGNCIDGDIEDMNDVMNNIMSNASWCLISARDEIDIHRPLELLNGQF